MADIYFQKIMNGISLQQIQLGRVIEKTCTGLKIQKLLIKIVNFGKISGIVNQHSKLPAVVMMIITN